MNDEMKSIIKSKSTRMLSALLAVLMVLAMLPTTAFAWAGEEGTKCTSTYGDKYLGADGDHFYSNVLRGDAPELVPVHTQRFRSAYTPAFPQDHPERHG